MVIPKAMTVLRLEDG